MTLGNLEWSLKYAYSIPYRQLPIWAYFHVLVDFKHSGPEAIKGPRMTLRNLLPKFQLFSTPYAQMRAKTVTEGVCIQLFYMTFCQYCAIFSFFRKFKPMAGRSIFVQISFILCSSESPDILLYYSDCAN